VLVVLLRNYVTMMHGQQNIKFKTEGTSCIFGTCLKFVPNPLIILPARGQEICASIFLCAAVAGKCVNTLGYATRNECYNEQFYQ
jgi:hypothetical protein